MERQFDRAVDDLGNVVALEHVNVSVPDQQNATIFYVTGLGLTRDPFLMTSAINMWIKVGAANFIYLEEGATGARICRRCYS